MTSKNWALSLKAFSEKHGVQMYLEPGEAIITKTTDLVVTVVDIVENVKKTAIVDSATEAHRLDTLIYNEPASVLEASETWQSRLCDWFMFMSCGRSVLRSEL